MYELSKRKLLKKSTIVFTLLCSLFFYFGCKKFDFSEEQKNKQDEAIVASFFKAPSNLNPTVNRVLETMKSFNEKETFVVKLVKDYGYIIWDKSLVGAINNRESNDVSSLAASTIAGVQKNGDTVVILPLVKPGNNYVDGFFKAVVGEQIIVTEFYRNSDYVALPKQNSEYANNHPEITTAENFAIMMMYLDKEVFGNTLFDIKDKTLFASTSTDQNTDTGRIKKQISFDNEGTSNFQLSCITYTEITTTTYVDCPWLKVGQNCPGVGTTPGQCDECEASCLTSVTTTRNYTVCHWTGSPGTGGGGTLFPTFPTSTGGGGNGGGSPPPPPPCPIVGPTISYYAIPSCPFIPNPWPPVIITNPPVVVNDSIVKALLKKDQQDIKAIRDSVWNLAYGPDIEYHFFIKNVNGTVNTLGINTDSSADAVSPNKYVRLTANPDGDYHTHQDHPNPSYRHPHDPQDVAISNAYHKKLFYRSYVDCGDTLYAVVTENLAKQKAFFQTVRINQIMESATWTQIGGAGTNRRTLGMQALKNFLGNSQTTGLGLYKTIDANKTEFIKLN